MWPFKQVYQSVHAINSAIFSNVTEVKNQFQNL